ncbi:MAG: DUF1598 domain-containing protein [Fuerstiella sp.]|nr:DUF1598 domain-containing protein [Fuerstiella sp.]MCP4856551.1 DUF1598 domain-containing protein [Fuerstiella sp.]
MSDIFRSLAAALVLCGLCFAQNNNQGQNNQGQNNQGQNNQGQNNQFPGGILINAEGVIASPQARRINAALEQKRLKALAGQHLSSEMATASELRKVSLVRLEKELQNAVDAGKEIDPELRYLAGITQLHYIFAVPETGDLVIAGPAEGFAPLQDGRVVGVESGRPVLTLDDLLVMLRLASTRQSLGCSFDPEPSRLAAAQAWNNANSSPASLNVAQQRFYQMAKVLGNWNVTIFGLPKSCHAAVTAVEADYQMKRIALGLDRPRIRGFRSYLDMARPGGNTMRRWWFAARYEVIERSPDGHVFHISGPRLQLLSQDELVDARGKRSDAAFTEITAEKYTRQFNKHMQALCTQVPSFAGIQNLFDLAVAAALIQSNDLPNAVGWQPTLLLDDKALPVQEYTVPTEVPSLVNVKSVSRSLLLGVTGGGVTIVPDRIIRRTNVLPADKTPEIMSGDSVASWWWD